jgi:hypothetical protein
MTEYYVHLLNYPVEADSPEEAVRLAIGEGGDGLRWNLGEMVYHVTDREADLRPRVWLGAGGGVEREAGGEAEDRGFELVKLVDALQED